MNRKFIFNLAPTGNIPNRTQTPYVPIQPDDIIDDVVEAINGGVNMVHLHVRDRNGQPSYEKAIFRIVIDGIRAYNEDVLICVSTSGRFFNNIEQRMEVLDLDGASKPDFASLMLGSLNFSQQVSINTPETISLLAQKMKERKIRPEFEAFDLGMINYSKYLIRKCALEPPYYFNLILGNIATAQADLRTLSHMIDELPSRSIWSIGGIGHRQLDMNITGMLCGGGVRTGIEDNLWLDRDRQHLAKNIDLVNQVVTISRCLGYEPYTPAEARALLCGSRSSSWSLQHTGE